MSSTRHSIIALIALTAAMTLGPVAPEAGNALFLAAGFAALISVWPVPSSQWRRPVVWMPLVALVLVGSAYGFSAGIEGLLGLAFFAPILAIPALTILCREIDPRPLGTILAVLALCGAAGAAIMAAHEVQLTGTARAGGAIANPIHFADVALLVGFVALIGLAVMPSRWRGLFLLGPIAAAIAILLSGTRGAIVALVAMVLVAALCMAMVRLVSRRLALVALAGLVAVGAVALGFGADQVSGVQRVLADLADMAVNGLPTDTSTGLRLQMYLGGFRAFLEAPLFGHGPVAFTAVAERLADTPFGGAPHLHNDLVDMAASAGTVGLAAYALLLLAPVLEALRAPASALKPWAIVLALTLISGFFVMGLTNAMFGILSVTTTFAAICVVIGLLTGPASADTEVERQADLAP